MTKYPNRTALFEACNIYRDTMRSFIISRLGQIWGQQVEDVVIDSLEPARANEIERILHQSNRSIESAIDINDFPHLVSKNWEDAFEIPLNHDKTFRNQLWLIKECRNADWAHPPQGDAESEGTRAYLFFIADVLSKIHDQDAKYEIEGIRDKLFSDDTAERLEKAEEEITELQKRLRAKSDQLEATKAEKAELAEGLKGVEADKAKLEKHLDVEKTKLKECLSRALEAKAEAEETGHEENCAKIEEHLPLNASSEDALADLQEYFLKPNVASGEAEVDAEITLEEADASEPSSINLDSDFTDGIIDDQPEEGQTTVSSEFSGEWTVEQIRNLVSEEMKDFHEANFPEERCNVFYRRVAEIQNLIEAEGWRLKTRFNKKSCRFWLTDKGVTRVKSVFGIHLQYNPLTLHVRIMKRDAEELKRQCGCEFYEVSKNEYADYTYYYVPDDITELRPVLEFAYRKHSGN